VTAVDEAAAPATPSTDRSDTRTATSSGRRAGRVPEWAPWLGVAAGLVAAQVALSPSDGFPSSWDVGLSDPINEFQKWAAVNRLEHWLFTGVLTPIGDAINGTYDRLVDLLLSMPWFLLPLVAFAVIARTGRWGSATFAAACLVYPEVAGLREPSMNTIALSLLCVVVCVLLGAPLGVWAGLRPSSERFLRPIVDVLQSLPTTLYLAPAVLLFGIGQTPAAIATVAFAIGPLVRITALGIREVPPASVEAGTMLGSTPRQLLWKVQFPQATPALLTGVNQTIMAALSMAVIGALVGAGGLGAEVFQTLSLRSPGRGLLVGLAITAIAIAFDRVVRSLVEPPTRAWAMGPRWWGGLAAGTVAAWAIGRAAGVTGSPYVVEADVVEPVDDLVIWIRDTFGDALQWINDLVVGDVVIPIRDLLGTDLAWPVVVGAAAALAWWASGWRLAVFAVAGLVVVGLLGMWSASVETLAQLLVAVVLSIVVAVPLGVALGTRPRLETAVNPFLETLQTLPSVIYAIPFTMVFAVGYLPGILSTALYAIPAGVRLAALAVRRVDEQALEASTTFGATPWQRLAGVRMPMAFDGIMLGVNQIIMMAMSMILITGLTGSQGLGYELVSALRKPDVGVGIEAGIAVVVMGILLDRIAAGAADRFSPTRRR
jgi:glycine betaine/proline transport system permease protein